MYEDATRVWHWHVICRGCSPKGYARDDGSIDGTTMVVATRGEAVVLRDDANDSIHGMHVGHRHVIEGCAHPDCILSVTNPA